MKKNKKLQSIQEEDIVIEKFLGLIQSEPLTEDEIARSMSDEFDYLEED